MISKTIKHNFW